MLSPPSAFRTFTICWSRDPALCLPDAPLEPTGDEAVDKKAQETWKEWDERFKRHREMGTINDLIQPGQQPTMFEIKPMSSMAMRRITDELNAQRIGFAVAFALGFRACVRGVVNFGEFKVTTSKHPTYGDLADEGIVNALDQLDPGIVAELGDYCFTRARSPSPK